METKMNIWLKAFAAACMVAAVSGIVRQYGLEDVIFFNKGILSLGVFFFGIHVVQKAWNLYCRERRSFAIAYLMSYGLTFSEILGTAMRLDVARGGVNLQMTGVVFMAGSALILAPVMVPLFSAIMNISLKPSGKIESTGQLNRMFLTVWLLLFAGYIPCILAFYPGLYCYDMVWQWTQFSVWDFTTHHPLLHTLFSGSVIELGKILGGSYNKGLFLHSLVQTMFLTGAMAYAIRFLIKRRTGRRGVVLIGAFFLLFPFFPVMGLSTTKDTMFAGWFLITFADVCDMVAERRFYQGWRLALFIVCSVLMCLFRNNAVYGLAVMVCGFIFAWLVQKVRGKENRIILKAAGLTMLCILLSQGMFLALEKGLRAKEGSKAEMLSLPMQQMARSYVYHPDEFSQEDKKELLELFDESWLLQYKYYLSDPVKAGIRMEVFEPRNFLRLWLRLGRQFPEEYVKSPLYNMMGLWYMGGDSSCYMEYGMSTPFNQEHWVEERSKLPWLKDYYSWFTDENLQKYLPGLSVFFYTSFYSWCVALAAGIIIAKRKYPYLILPLFLACYSFTLIFGPCMTIRYFLEIILCVPILGIMVFQEEYRYCSLHD